MTNYGAITWCPFTQQSLDFNGRTMSETAHRAWAFSHTVINSWSWKCNNSNG